MKRLFMGLLKWGGVILFYLSLLVGATYLTMSVLIRGEEVVAPTLVGMPVEQAARLAQAQGFVLKAVEGSYGSRYPASTVVEQFPVAGVHIKRQGVVKVVVCGVVRKVVVPDFRGLSLDEGEARLSDLGLSKGVLTYMDSPEVPVDGVVSQTPAAGSEVLAGTPVALLISRGKADQTYVMPDLIGLKAERAVVFFERQGLRVNHMEYVTYPGIPSGVVVRQFPPSGFDITRRNLITLQVVQ